MSQRASGWRVKEGSEHREHLMRATGHVHVGSVREDREFRVRDETERLDGLIDADEVLVADQVERWQIAPTIAAAREIRPAKPSGRGSWRGRARNR